MGGAIASCFLCSGFLVLAVWTVSGSQGSPGSASSRLAPARSLKLQLPPNNAYDTTVQYVETFYPLWFTYNQAVEVNHLVGPDGFASLPFRRHDQRRHRLL